MAWDSNEVCLCMQQQPLVWMGHLQLGYRKLVISADANLPENSVSGWFVLSSTSLTLVSSCHTLFQGWLRLKTSTPFIYSFNQLVNLWCLASLYIGCFHQLEVLNVTLPCRHSSATSQAAKILSQLRTLKQNVHNSVQKSSTHHSLIGACIF